MERLIKFLIARRTQHADNLAGWSEGRLCSCSRQLFPPQAAFQRNCPLCDGTGIARGSQGYLVPTEPDPDERAAVRERLQVAIDELDKVLEWIKASTLGAPQWIDEHDGLPPPQPGQPIVSQRVLVAVFGKYLHVAYYHYEDARWKVEGTDQTDVTHWARLLAPPMEDHPNGH